jgi:hypothetical protein
MVGSSFFNRKRGIVPEAKLNDSGGLWRVETVHQNKNRKTGQLFFGQFRTLGLRKSARFVQTP